MDNLVLIICGPSGSGKSTLEQNLIEEYPNIFHKLQQITTREPRKNESPGNPYIFIQESTFNFLQDKLIGRLGCSENSLFKDKYGSIPDFKKFHISTIILAEEALLDFKNNIKNIGNDIEYFVLGLDVNYDNLSIDVKREGRDDNFIEKERSVLNLADMIFRNKNGKYIEPKAVLEVLRSHYGEEFPI